MPLLEKNIVSEPPHLERKVTEIIISPGMNVNQFLLTAARQISAPPEKKIASQYRIALKTTQIHTLATIIASPSGAPAVELT